MAAITHGTIFTYGLSETGGAYGVIVGKDLTKNFRNMVESKDASGNVVGMRLDDRLETGTLTLQLESGSILPTIGSTLSLKDVDGTSQTFVIMEVGRAESNADNVRVTCNVRNDEKF